MMMKNKTGKLMDFQSLIIELEVERFVLNEQVPFTNRQQACLARNESGSWRVRIDWCRRRGNPVSARKKDLLLV